MNQVSCQRLFRYGGGDSSPPVSAPGWGWRGCKRTPKIFDSLKIWAKTLKSGKKWPPVFALTSKNGAQCLHKNTRDLILEVTPKRVLHDLCGRKFMGKSCTKTFRASLGKFVQNFAPQKFACFYTYDEKSPPPPLPLIWKGRGGKASAMLPLSGASVHIILHALSLLVVALSCNVSLQWT